MFDSHGEFGFIFGGTIYHSDYKSLLRSQQKEICESFRRDLDEFREKYPIRKMIDSYAFDALVKDYDDVRLENLDEQIVRFQ